MLKQSYSYRKSIETHEKSKRKGKGKLKYAILQKQVKSSQVQVNRISLFHEKQVGLQPPFPQTPSVPPSPWGVITRSKYVLRVNLNGYKVLSRRDRKKLLGGLIELARQSFIGKIIREYKTKYDHSICSELQFQNKSRSRPSGIYKSPSSENMKKLQSNGSK